MKSLIVPQYIASGQIRHGNGRPRLKNLLHAWRQLKRYKQLKKQRLDMAQHALRHKTKNKMKPKEKHKKNHKLKHRLKLKLSHKKMEKELVLKHANDHHHHHHIHSKNNTKHGKTVSRFHGGNMKTVHVHNNAKVIKEGTLV